MKSYTLILLCLFLSFKSLGQLFDQYGIYLQRNLSDQDVRLSDHSFGWGVIHTWGFGIYGVKSTPEKVDFKYRLAYTQKGFHDSFTLNGELIYSNRNELDYLSVDFLVQKSWREGFFRPYVAAGLSATSLVRTDAAAFIGSSVFLRRPPLSPDEFNTFGLGGIYTLGANLGKACFLEAGMSLDLLPALKDSNVTIRNLLLSLGMGIHLNELITKR